MDHKILTAKQNEILELVRRGAPDGGLVDMDQLHAALSYECSKQALQCSVRILERRGYLERRPGELRRERRRRVIALTTVAAQAFDPSSGAFDVVIEGLDDAED